MKTVAKKNETSSGIGKVVLGTAIGVGIGAAAVALSNKDNRKAMLDKTSALKKDAESSLEDGKNELQGVRKTLENKLDEVMREHEPEVELAEKTAKVISKKATAAKKA